MLRIYLLVMLASLWFWQGAQQLNQEEIPYSEFLQHLDKGEVKDAVLTDHVITGSLTETDPKTNKPRSFVTQRPEDDALAQSLSQHGVKFKVVQQSNWLSSFLLNWVLPFGALFLLWGWFAKRMGSRGLLNLGANRVHIHAETGVRVTFDDVGGADEAKEELKEVIDFLKNPARIQSLGGRMPKGVLLVGPPGTGKTLLARAVSGEAGVPFFSMSGSEFIELFVGVGAARVRELFEQARQKAPCIIFIDELDAVGGARGIAPALGRHDEREQTLNQLLSEMDGFDPSTGMAVMAATNRPEILDKALLRAGRFDRQIVVDKPDLEERTAILKLHTRRMKLGTDVDLRVVAQRTPGFVGADLANIANEAAIRAVRHGHQAISMPDFEEAIDRVIAGPEKKHRVLNANEKRRVAFHESGHALVALAVPTGEPLHKVSIIPRGVAALGYTLQLPVQEKFLSTEQQLKDQLAILLGGPGCRGTGLRRRVERRPKRPRAREPDCSEHGHAAWHEPEARAAHLSASAGAGLPRRHRRGGTQLQRGHGAPDRCRGACAGRGGTQAGQRHPVRPASCARRAGGRVAGARGDGPGGGRALGP
jgi:cell division protease FtsH